MRELKLSRPRMGGRDVDLLEEHLNRWGNPVDCPGKHVYNEDHYENVKWFQRVHRLPATGRVDPETWARLYTEVLPWVNPFNPLKLGRPRVELLRCAIATLGVPFCWGSSKPKVGLDQVGFVEFVAWVALADLPQEGETIDTLYEKCPRVEVPEPGDLVFYQGRKQHRPTHLMMVLDKVWCIGPTGGNSKTTTSERAALRDACVKVKSLNYRKEVIGYRKFPNLP